MRSLSPRRRAVCALAAVGVGVLAPLGANAFSGSSSTSVASAELDAAIPRCVEVEPKKPINKYVQRVFVCPLDKKGEVEVEV